MWFTGHNVTKNTVITPNAGVRFEFRPATTAAGTRACPPPAAGGRLLRALCASGMRSGGGDGREARGERRAVLARVALVVLPLLVAGGCHGSTPASCDEVPTTADGCRERCHDRGAEMTFFRWAPGTYRCDAICVCGNDDSG